MQKQQPVLYIMIHSFNGSDANPPLCSGILVPICRINHSRTEEAKTILLSNDGKTKD